MALWQVGVCCVNVIKCFFSFKISFVFYELIQVQPTLPPSFFLSAGLQCCTVGCHCSQPVLFCWEIPVLLWHFAELCLYFFSVHLSHTLTALFKHYQKNPAAFLTVGAHQRSLRCVNQFPFYNALITVHCFDTYQHSFFSDDVFFLSC